MIKVCDAFMGAGKTSAAINYMRSNSDKRFIYITPYYDETVRIRDSCSGLRFWLPSNAYERYDHAKRNHLKYLVSEGKNVAITHALFKLCDNETISIIRAQNYVIIIDEVVDVFSRLEITSSDIEMIIDSGWLQVKENNGKKEYYYDIHSAEKKYQGGRFVDLFVYTSSQRIVEINEGDEGSGLWYWTLHDGLFTGDNEVIILTFMFSGSVMAGYLAACGSQIKNIGVKKMPVTTTAGGDVYEFVDRPQCPPDYVGDLSSMISILDNKRMNEVGEKIYALSYNWYKTRLANDRKDELQNLRKNVQNFFKNISGTKESNSRLWSTYKSAKGRIKGNGYTNSFLSFTTKATNRYRSCTALAYLVNVYHDPNIKNYFSQKGVVINDNEYALSTMVQWIWRSAIRDGKPICIYLPSRRMRTILKDWIESSEETYHRLKSAEAE